MNKKSMYNIYIMGNTDSSEADDDMKEEYETYIKQQQRVIDQQQHKINSMSQNSMSSSQNMYQQMGKLPPNKYKPVSQEKQKFDPYKILNIGRQHSEEELKRAYVKLAMKTHPDRGGDEKQFQVVSMAYKILLKKRKDSKNNHDHRQLRQNSQVSIESQDKMNAEQMDMTLFNKVYEEHKIEGAFDEGYGGWMKSNKVNDNGPTKMFDGDFNKETFHSEFDKYKQKKKGQEIQHYEPQTSISYKGKDSLTVLGQHKVTDFSGTSDGGLAYRDYKDAFENSCFIDVSKVNIDGRANSIDAQKDQRGNIDYVMSHEDQRRQHLHKKQEEEAEQKRIERLKLFEERSGEAYDKIHRRLLGR